MDLSSFELGTVYSKFKGFQYQITKVDQTGLALYWWQRLITFDSSRLRVI
jgi:hypothetical protein